MESWEDGRRPGDQELAAMDQFTSIYFSDVKLDGVAWHVLLGSWVKTGNKLTFGNYYG